MEKESQPGLVDRDNEVCRSSGWFLGRLVACRPRLIPRQSPGRHAFPERALERTAEQNSRGRRYSGCVDLDRLPAATRISGMGGGMRIVTEHCESRRGP